MNLTDILAAEAEKGCCPLDSSMSAFPAEAPVGMAYVPYQKWKNVYDPAVALERATVFQELDKPFLGEKAV